MDLDVVFLGTSGGMPSAQRAPPALLVRRGGERLLFDCGEGTQRQLLRSTVGLVDLRRDLPHALPRGPLPRPAGMLKTFALRGREVPLTIYGPPGLRDLFGALRRIFGKLTYPLELVELRAGRGARARRLRDRPFAVTHGVSALGYALVEEPRPGRFDVETADALGVPNGPERGALQRGEAVTLADGRVVTPDAVLGPPRPGRKIVLAGDTEPIATRDRGSRRAPTCSSTRRRSARRRPTAPRHAPLDRARRGRASRATRGVAPARADARLAALLRPRGRRRGARGLPRDGRAAGTSISIEVRFEERGGAELVKGGARARATRGA